MSLNKVILMGRLGIDPELKKIVASGASVCNLSVATTETWLDKSSKEKQERTHWHRVIVWGKQAELCAQYLKKGREIFLEGKVVPRSYDDKDGNKKYTTEIVADFVRFIGKGKQEGGEGELNNKLEEARGSYDFTADDIPF